jgi:hypothetical protein
MPPGFAESLRSAGPDDPGVFGPYDLRAAYLAGHAAGKRDATTWRDPVADPPEVPEGGRWVDVLTVSVEARPVGAYVTVETYYRGTGWGSPVPLAWMHLPPLPKETP